MAGRKLRRKTERRKSRGGHYKRYKHQTGRLLNRYDFVYAGGDTVNQAMKGLNFLAPRLIKQTSDEVNRLVQRRMKHKLHSGYSGHLEETNCHNGKKVKQNFQEIMFEQEIYHSCATGNKDETRILIDFENGEKCLLPTSYPFWKNPEDCCNKCVLTRSSAQKIRKNKAFASKLAIRKYYENLQTIKQ